MLYRFTGILSILFKLYLILRVKDMKIYALYSYTIEEATFKLYPKDRNFIQIYATVNPFNLPILSYQVYENSQWEMSKIVSRIL